MARKITITITDEESTILAREEYSFADHITEIGIVPLHRHRSCIDCVDELSLGVKEG